MEDKKSKPQYQFINGIRFPNHDQDRLKEVMNYKPTPDDVFIVTYPKCGTTWLQNIALYIFRRGKALEDPKDFHKMSPFIEITGLQGIINMPRPGAFKTHLPYSLMPYSPDAKYIFVLRNPKDVCVSLFYHAKYCGHVGSDTTFDDFFELFMKGEVNHGDYFDHLESWYSHRNDEHVFYTTYEDLKEDPKNVVLRLAAFLGKEYLQAIEKDKSVLDNILKFSGFDYMKDHLTEIKDTDHSKKGGGEKDISQSVANNPPSSPPGGMRLFKKEHFRKGIVGDWRNYFSKEQSERLNQKFFERLEGTEIYEKYKPYL